MLRYFTHIKDWWTDPFRIRPNWAEVIILCLTAAIVLIYLGQLHEMQGAGQQTADLIEAARIQARASRRIEVAARRVSRAADRNAEAAEDFASAAQTQTQHMGKLVKQVTAGVVTQKQIAATASGLRISSYGATFFVDKTNHIWASVQFKNESDRMPESVSAVAILDFALPSEEQRQTFTHFTPVRLEELGPGGKKGLFFPSPHYKIRKDAKRAYVWGEVIPTIYDFPLPTRFCRYILIEEIFTSPKNKDGDYQDDNGLECPYP